jgi:hypothetical protein
MTIASHSVGQNPLGDQLRGWATTMKPPPNRRLIAKPDRTATPEPR